MPQSPQYVIITSVEGKTLFTTTVCANYCRPLLPGYVDFSEGEKPSKHRKDQLTRNTKRDLISVLKGKTR